MSEIIAKAAKIAFFGIIIAVFVSFLATVLTTAIDIGDSLTVLTNVPVEISDALLTGRRLANNFIPPHAFNACITIWFTGSAAMIANYALITVGGKIAGISS